MRFYWKVFFSIFLAASVSSAGVSIYVYYLFAGSMADNYRRHHESIVMMVVDTLKEMEKLTDILMLNAAQAVREVEHRKGISSSDDLKNLRDKLSVSELYLIEKSGKYSLATDGPISQQPKNFFDFCSDYKKLITGESAQEQTPILLGVPPKNTTPYKFTQIPNFNRTRLVEVGMHMRFIGTTLKGALASNVNILSLGLYTPAGQRLGFISNRGENSFEKANLVDQVPVALAVKSSGNLVFDAEVPANAARCCQCQTKGLTRAGDKYSYTLRAEVSRVPLLSMLESLRRKLIFFFGALLILSAALARFLTDRLLVRMKLVQQGVREVMASRDLSRRLNIRGEDEIADLGRTFDKMVESLGLAHKEVVSAERVKSVAAVATQVAHDIRSPLAALAVVEPELRDLPEDTRLLVRSAIQRIRDIANHLLEKYRQVTISENGADQRMGLHLLGVLIEEIVTEKRIQYRSRINLGIDSQLDESGFGVFARVEAVGFRRVLSNLINNSAEAIDPERPGRILVRLFSADVQTIVIEVEDTGIGFDVSSYVARVGDGTEVTTKLEGYGLGLPNARRLLSSWGGQLQIDSQVGKGTTVRIELPRSAAPAWFLAKLRVEKRSKLVILDDDLSIHGVWRGRLSQCGRDAASIEMISLSTPNEFRDFVISHSDSDCAVTYLVDYELLGFDSNGLDLVAELDICEKTVLVTSRFDDSEIRKRCDSLGVPLIPKGMAGFVPLEIV